MHWTFRGRSYGGATAVAVRRSQHSSCAYVIRWPNARSCTRPPLFDAFDCGRAIADFAVLAASPEDAGTGAPPGRSDTAVVASFVADESTSGRACDILPRALPHLLPSLTGARPFGPSHACNSAHSHTHQHQHPHICTLALILPAIQSVTAMSAWIGNHARAKAHAVHACMHRLVHVPPHALPHLLQSCTGTLTYSV